MAFEHVKFYSQGTSEPLIFFFFWFVCSFFLLLFIFVLLLKVLFNFDFHFVINLFQGRQGDQNQGFLSATEEKSHPQPLVKWGGPKSIFQALVAFLL